MLTVSVTVTGGYICSIAQLLHLNEINMMLYGAEYNNIELSFALFNIVLLCSIKPCIDLVQCSNCIIFNAFIVTKFVLALLSKKMLIMFSILPTNRKT